jgi:hypothetical protein
MERRNRMLAASLAGLGFLALVTARVQAAGAVPPAQLPGPPNLPGMPQFKAPATVMQFRDAKGLNDWAASVLRLPKDPNYANAVTGTIGGGATATADKVTGIINLLVQQNRKSRCVAGAAFETAGVSFAPFGKVTATVSTRVEALNIQPAAISTKNPIINPFLVRFPGNGEDDVITSKHVYITKPGVYDITLDPTTIQPVERYFAAAMVIANTEPVPNGPAIVRATDVKVPFITWKFITTPLPIPKPPK